VTSTLAACRVGRADGPSQAALEELLELIDRLCDHGDSCPSLRGEGVNSCDALHSAGLAALQEIPAWVRETALTFVRAHPLADPTSAARAKEALARDGQPAWGLNRAWKDGLGRIARRWLKNPEARMREPPPLPAPHPDAAPSGAPRGVKRSDLEDLKSLLGRICIRVLNCKFEPKNQCRKLHPGHLRAAGVSAWVHDEFERLMRTHP
jgi:hypothetical protein